MENNQLVKHDGGLIKRVGNAISVTNKLLALAEPQLIPYRKKDKWGFCTPDKKIVIDCVWDEAEPFIEGLAKVKLGEKYNYENKKGKLISEFYSDDVVIHSRNLVGVKLNNKWGFIDFDGNLVIPFLYEDIFRYKSILGIIALFLLS